MLLVIEKNKKQVENLFIHNDKALIEVNIFLDEKKNSMNTRKNLFLIY